MDAHINHPSRKAQSCSKGKKICSLCPRGRWALQPSGEVQHPPSLPMSNLVKQKPFCCPVTLLCLYQGPGREWSPKHSALFFPFLHGILQKSTKKKRSIIRYSGEGRLGRDRSSHPLKCVPFQLLTSTRKVSNYFLNDPNIFCHSLSFLAWFTYLLFLAWNNTSWHLFPVCFSLISIYSTFSYPLTMLK